METGDSLKRRLDDIRRAEEAYLADVNRKADWDDPLDVAEYRREERMKERNEVLGRLVADRVCPICGTMKLESVAWVISRDCRKAVCRSCYFRRFPIKTVNSADRLFVEEPRFAVDGAAIARLRVQTGVSVREFARRVGWSRAHQRNIEEGRVGSVSSESASAILQVFAEMGVTTRDCT